MYKYAILIDAGFIKKKLGSTNNSLTTVEPIIDFVEKVKSEVSQIIETDAFLYRIYYYDAHPASFKVKNPISNAPTNLQSTDTYRANKSILDRLKKAPNFAIRLGECVDRGWKVKGHVLRKNDGAGTVNVVESDLSMNIQQKGVDMRIGLDVASLALKKQVDGIVLISGDSDFIPPMKFARKEGLQMILCTMNAPVKNEMFEHCDIALDLSV